jgi:very-short-patch-repair endonuclease
MRIIKIKDFIPLRTVKLNKKGKIESIETRKMKSDTHKKMWRDSEYRKMMSIAHKDCRIGYKHSKETKKKLAIISREKWTNAEYRQRIIGKLNNYIKNNPNPFKGRKHSEETKRKMRIKKPWLTKRNLLNNPSKSLEAREKIRQSLNKRMLGNPELHPNRILAKLSKNQSKRISQPQILLYNIIKQVYSDAELNHPLKVNENKRLRFLDVGIPSLKIDIEYDEPYWHNENKDAIRKQEIEKQGWKVISITNEKEIPNVITTIKTIEHNQVN